MRLAFTQEQEDLRATVRRVLTDRSTPDFVRECWDDPTRWRQLWAEVQELGWLALMVPESADGLALGTVELVAVMELAGGANLPIPLAATIAMALPVVLAGEPATADLHLASAGPAALAADGLGSPLRAGHRSLQVTANRLHGDVHGVRDASRAELLVLTVLREVEPIVVLLGADRTKIHEPAAPLDPTSPTNDVSVDVDLRTTRVLTGDVDRGLAVARIGLAAELIGGCDRMLALAITHSKSRAQFGQPIGSFQAVQHLLADGFLAVQRARALTYAAAIAADRPEEPTTDVAIAACLAKAAASEAGNDVSRIAVQVHGALAMTAEHDLHLYLHRAWMVAMQLGGARENYEWAARLAAERRAS